MIVNSLEALNYAMALNHGRSRPAEEVIEDAKKFLEFLQSEKKTSNKKKGKR